MATIVRLDDEQIAHLLNQADEMENTLKQLHSELTALDIPKNTLHRFSRMHDRFTSAIEFLRKQRNLGTQAMTAEGETHAHGDLLDQVKRDIDLPQKGSA